MPVGDRFADRQSDAGAGVLRLRMQPPERFKNRPRIFLVESNAVVRDFEQRAAVVGRGGLDANLRGFVRFAIFDRVGNDIGYQAGEFIRGPP